MVELLRGGESVGQSTLTRFYSLHTFVLPWSLAVFMLMHFLMILPFIENVNKFSNPFRRPIAMSVFLFGTFLTIYLGIGACLPIDKSLTLGLF